MIKQTYPEEFAMRDQDKYHYRYPGGEVRTVVWPLEALPRVLCSVCPSGLSVVLPGPGTATRACHYGAGASRQRAGHLSSGCYALSSGLLPGQKCRYTIYRLFISDLN